MNIINVKQGSPEWHELRAKYFTASEAPAMMGASKYMNRSALLEQKATGKVPEVSEDKQRLFNKGHAAEAAARPVLESQIKDELFPATATTEVEGLPLLASFDGINMMETVVFEHKLYGKELAEAVLSENLDPHYYWQLEHQLLVSGADAVIFVCSDGTPENWAQCQYFSKPERRKALIAGWQQFAKDLSEYVPTEATEVVEAEPVRDLPAINYKMDGLSLHSNLDEYKEAATALVELSKKPLESDQDFANAEARQKVFTKAEKDIKDACDRVMGEIDSIDKFVKDMRFISENIRQARLAEGKQIKARKEEIRGEIYWNAMAVIDKAVKEASETVNAHLPELNIDITGAMKGKKTIDSLRDAADTEVARGKVEITEYQNTALANAKLLEQNADFKFLFNDWPQIAFKATDDFAALVKARIAEHKEREHQRQEEERARIRAEEEAKARREAEQKLRAEESAKQAESKPVQEPAPEVHQEQGCSPAPAQSQSVRYESRTRNTLGMMEINAIIQFVSSITANEQSDFATQLKERADSYIAQHHKDAA